MAQIRKAGDTASKGPQIQVSEYSFKSFDRESAPDSVEEYTFLDFGHGTVRHAVEDGKRLKIERNEAERLGFSISPLVRQYRGHNQSERDEKEQVIREEVERRLVLLREKAEKQGYEAGLERGKKDVYQQLMSATEEKLSTLGEMIDGVLSGQKDLLLSNRDSIYKLVKNLSKWIILRELKDDQDYPKRLLERLIQEIEGRSGLLLLVNAEDFAKMPEILDHIKQKFGDVGPIRVEIDPDIQSFGMVLESENGILNATIEEQFRCLDKLFEGVGANEQNGGN